MIEVVLCAEMLVAIATLIAVVSSVVLVLVVVVVASLPISNAISISSMVIRHIYVITDLIQHISFMTLWYCMILLLHSLCSIVTLNHNSKSNTWVNPTNTKSQNQSTPIEVILSAMLANSSSQENTNSTWILDSGASFHVTGETQNTHQLGHFD